MNILITGINGLVGSALACGFSRLNSQADIYGIDLQENCVYAACKGYQSGDITQSIQPDLPRMDVVVHAAACITGTNKTIFDVNVLGTAQIVRLARRLKCRTFVFISSMQVLGIPKICPIDETHPVHPNSRYHHSKWMGEEIVLGAGGMGFQTVVFRIASPQPFCLQGDKILSVFVRNALEARPIVLRGRGERIQNYIAVEDIARGILQADAAGVSGLYHLAGESISNRALAQRVVDATQSNTQIVFEGEDPQENDRWIISTKKAEQAFGYQACHDIQSMIAHCL